MSDGRDIRKLKTQFYRWLLIDEQISAGRCPNAESLARDIEVSPRTIKRDLEYFRDMLGVPLEYDAARRGYRYTEPSYRLPLVMMQESELFSIFLAEKVLAQYRGAPLYGTLKSVFDKLTGFLPETVSVPTNMLQDTFSVFSEPSPEIDREVWARVFDALRDSVTVTFDYRTPGRPQPVPRTVDPYHAVCYRGECYLIGYCHTGKEERTYALSRMGKVESTGARFTRPPGFDARAYFGNSFGIFRGDREYRVVLRFAPAQAPYVLERSWHATEEKTVQPDGGVILSFSANHLFEVKRWVLSWGAGVTVLEPEELRQDVLRELAEAARNYAAEGDAGPADGNGG